MDFVYLNGSIFYIFVLKPDLVGFDVKQNTIYNLAKLGDGLDESPTVMFKKRNKKLLGNNRGILNPSWAFDVTKICFTCVSA